MNVLRVALPGYDALEETDPSRFSLFSDSENVLIKEFARGSGHISYDGTATITHNLGYIPFYLVYGEVAAGKYRAANWYSLFDGVWRAYADTSKLYIRNNVSTDVSGFQYYLFYDNLT